MPSKCLRLKENTSQHIDMIILLSFCSQIHAFFFFFAMCTAKRRATIHFIVLFVFCQRTVMNIFNFSWWWLHILLQIVLLKGRLTTQMFLI